MTPIAGDERGLGLTLAQSGVWYAHQLDPKNPTLTVGECVRITGSLDLSAFQSAYRRAVHETACLNARPVETGRGPGQIVEGATGFPLPVIDLSADAAPVQAARSWMADRLAAPIDLMSDPLHQAALLVVAPDQVWWYQRYHQFLMDGYGWSMFAGRVARGYGGPGCGDLESRVEEFGDLRLLVGEEAGYRSSTACATDRGYWLERLRGIAEPAGLTGRLSGPAATFLRRESRLADSTREALSDLGDRAGTRWSRVLIALVAAYLRRITGSDDVVLGLAVPGRTTPLARSTPARMSNLLPLRLSVTSRCTLADLVQEVAAGLRDLLRHQRYRGEDLRRELNWAPASPRHFGPTLNIVPFDYDLRFGHCRTEFRNMCAGPVEDISITFFDRRDARALGLQVEANPDLYDEPDLASHQRRLQRFIDAVPGIDPDRPVGEHDVLTDDERRKIFVTWNSRDTRFPADRSLAGLFAASVARTPEAPAVRYGRRALTYRQLDERANQFAHLLIEAGIGRGDRVAILLERDVPMLVAILGITKAGAAYVPLDAASPVDRVGFVLDDARISLVVSEMVRGGEEGPGFRRPGVRLLNVRDARLDALPVSPPRGTATADDAAYVMYTSGSTGEPKGVVVSHRAIARLVLGTDYVQIVGTDRVGQVSNVAFDAATFEIWGALLNGACLVGLPRETILAPERFAAAIRDERISVMFLTVALFREVVRARPDAFATMRALLFGGEAADAAAVRIAMEHPAQMMINGYGPTEATTFAVCHHVRSVPPGDGGVPIGRPIANTPCHVLDEQLRPAPVGVPGELCIGGPGLAQEYLGRPAMTARSFVPDPFSGDGGRLYRTGDRARWTHDGVLEYLGRFDQQIKVRGHRVEPGEIEATLGRHHGVTAAAVVAQGEGNDRRLIGYVVPRESHDVGLEASIGSHLRRWLPGYMVPLIIFVERLPLTENGKVDRAALPPPELDGPRGEPRTPLERLLSAVWCAVLGVPRVGIHDSFTGLGGNSLQLAEIGTVIQRTLRIRLPLSALFHAQTIADLTTAVTSAAHEPAQVDRAAELALRILTLDDERVRLEIAERGDVEA